MDSNLSQPLHRGKHNISATAPNNNTEEHNNPVFPLCIINIITGYAEENRLLKWLNVKIDWEILSENPAAISLLEINKYRIDWLRLSRNYAAIFLLESNPKRMEWNSLSFNSAAIFLLETNPDKIDWSGLARNPAALSILRDNLHKIDWRDLSDNNAAISIIESDLKDRVLDYPEYLSGNPAAVFILEIINETEYNLTSQNSAAIFLLETNSDEIDWNWLLANPSAIHLLRDNEYDELILFNSAIFQSNKQEIYKRLYSF